MQLSACLFEEENAPPVPPRAGAYRGDHGAITRLHGFESELILGEDGSYRYFLIDTNTAFYTAKGRWKASDKEMVCKGVTRSFLYHGGFKTWDTLAAPDTSYLRNVSDSGFERLEVTYDSQYVSVLHWVEYRRLSPVGALPEGAFAFTESHPDGVDSTLTVTDSTRVEITRNGHYVQHTYRNGEPYISDVDSSWTQAGSFLITSRNRHCEYEPGYTSCSNAPLDYEFVARLDDVRETAFHLWLAPGFTYKPVPYWAEFLKSP